jgi:hypothetical protein
MRAVSGATDDKGGYRRRWCRDLSGYIGRLWISAVRSALSGRCPANVQRHHDPEVCFLAVWRCVVNDESSGDRPQIGQLVTKNILPTGSEVVGRTTT